MNDTQPSDRTARITQDIEAKIREMEKAPQGLDVLYRALKLFDQVNLGLELRLEGSPPRLLRVRNNAGTFHELENQDGIYTDHYHHGPEGGIERFASLERLAWWVAERTIPRIYARAYSSAEHRGNCCGYGSPTRWEFQ